MNGIALEVNNLTKSYPGIEALKEISFHVSKGAVHGFLGPNGAGKSTTLKILAGLIQPTKGDYIARGKIGFLPEAPPLYKDMRVRDYLKFIFEIQTLRSKRKCPWDKVIEQCGIGSFLERSIGNLSKGMGQRVGIASTLIYDPEIIILDEPTVGLDPQSVAQMRTLIRDIGGDKTVLISTHLLHEVNVLANEMTIINRGEIVESGSIDIFQHRFQSQNMIQATVRNWEKSWQSEIEDKNFIDHISIERCGENYHLRVQSKGKDEDSEFLGRFLVEKGAGLIEIKKRQYDLEEIFQEATK